MTSGIRVKKTPTVFKYAGSDQFRYRTNLTTAWSNEQSVAMPQSYDITPSMPLIMDPQKSSPP